MRRSSAAGILTLFGLGGFGSFSYYSFSNFKSKDLVEEVQDICEKVMNLSKKIEDKIKNHKHKEDLKRFKILLINLTKLKKSHAIWMDDNDNFDQEEAKKHRIKKLEDDLEELSKKILGENLTNYELQEIYKEIEDLALSIFEVYKKIEILKQKEAELKEKMNQIKGEINKKIAEEDEDFEKLKNLNEEIKIIVKDILNEKFFKKNFKDIKNLEKEIFEKQEKIKNELLKEGFKDLQTKIRGWLSFDIELSKLSGLLEILRSVPDPGDEGYLYE